MFFGTENRADFPTEIAYCRETNQAIWFLPGSGMGIVQAKGLQMLAEIVDSLSVFQFGRQRPTRVASPVVLALGSPSSWLTLAGWFSMNFGGNGELMIEPECCNSSLIRKSLPLSCRPSAPPTEPRPIQFENENTNLNE